MKKETIAKVATLFGAATGCLMRAQNTLNAGKPQSAKCDAYEALQNLERAIDLLPPLTRKGNR